MLHNCSSTRDGVGVAGVILSTQIIGNGSFGSFLNDPIELDFQVAVSQRVGSFYVCTKMILATGW